MQPIEQETEPAGDLDNPNPVLMPARVLIAVRTDRGRLLQLRWVSCSRWC